MSEHDPNKNDPLATRTDVVATLHKLEAKDKKIRAVGVENEEFGQKGLRARVRQLQHFAHESQGKVGKVFHHIPKLPEWSIKVEY